MPLRIVQVQSYEQWFDFGGVSGRRDDTTQIEMLTGVGMEQ